MLEVGEKIKLKYVPDGHYIIDKNAVYIFKKLKNNLLQCYKEYSSLVRVERFCKPLDILQDYKLEDFIYLTGDKTILKKFIRKHHKNLLKEISKRKIIFEKGLI